MAQAPDTAPSDPALASFRTPRTTYRVRRHSRSVLEVELELSGLPPSGVPHRLEWPAAIHPACIRNFEIEPDPKAPDSDPFVRAIEAAAQGEAAAATAWHIELPVELPAKTPLRIRYQLAPAWPAPPPTQPTRDVTLLIGAESFLCAGTWPFGRFSGVEEVRLEFDLGPCAFASAAHSSSAHSAIPEATLDEVLFAFGPWRVEDHAVAELLIPAEGLQIDVQGSAFAEDQAAVLRALLARRSVALERAFRTRPLLALLPQPPAQSSPYLFYVGGTELVRGARVWRIPTRLSAEPLELARRLHAELPELRALAARDAPLAEAFASTFALSTLTSSERLRERQRDLPCCPLRATAEDRARWALLEFFERDEGVLERSLYTHLERDHSDLAHAWQRTLGERDDASFARFQAVRNATRLIHSAALGGPFAVREINALPEPGLYRMQERNEPHAIAATQLSERERVAWRDLCARLALELAWPLAERRKRSPAWDPSDFEFRGRDEFLIDFDALYDAEAGWAGDLAAGEALRRLVVGGHLQRSENRLLQRLQWRCDDLALCVELEWQGVDGPALGPPADALDPEVARVRTPRRERPLRLIVRGLEFPEDPRGRTEWCWHWITALDAAPAWSEEGEEPTSQTPRAGSAICTPTHAAAASCSNTAHAKSCGHSAPGPRGYSGVPLGDRGSFGFQRWHEAVQAWVPTALETDDFDARKQPEEAALHAQLLALFNAGLQWPLPRIADLQPRWGGDDLPYRAGHDSAHDAIDIGARLYREGTAWPYHYPAGTPVFSPHRNAKRLVHPAGYPVLLIEIGAGDYRLRVRMDLVHVRPSEAWRNLDPQQVVPEGFVIGTLEAFDSSSPWGGWITTDPKLRMRGESKGNHLHLATAGLYETRSADLRRNERKNHYFRAEFYPALEQRYAAAPALALQAIHQAPTSSTAAAPIAELEPGFHAIFDGVEYQSALARDDYDAERQPLEHAAYAAAMRSRMRSAQPVRDRESGVHRPIWNDGWLTQAKNGDLIQRVETPVEIAGASYRLRLEVHYHGLQATADQLGAVGVETRFEKSSAAAQPSVELLRFDLRSPAAERLARLLSD